MNYDFTTLPDRSSSTAEKFVNMRRIDPSVPPNIIPFSVADMDFLPAPARKGTSGLHWPHDFRLHADPKQLL